jgi:hypothetical protein
MSDVERVNNAEKLLPAWFVPRMMRDVWGFGFLLSSGDRVHFERINDVCQAADGTIWIDVTLHVRQPRSNNADGNYILALESDRKKASINAAHIVMAFETETS